MTSSPAPAFRFIDLFAGLGGFHHALSAPEFGGECVLAVDIDKDCREVYGKTWPEMAAADAIKADIRAITMNPDGTVKTLEEIDAIVPDHDVLCGGFPCQPFSKSGMQRGITDTTRGTLFFDILKIVQAKKPRFLILENVRNLAGPKHTDTWATIVASLRENGYRVSSTPVVLSPHLIAPQAGGRPQSRDRVYILASRVDGEVPAEELMEDPLLRREPFPEGWDPSRWDVEDYLLDDKKIENLDEYLLKPNELAWLNAWQAFIQGIPDDNLPGFPIWVEAFQANPSIPSGTPGWKESILRKNSEFYVANKEFIDTWLQMNWAVDGLEEGTVYTVKDFPPTRQHLEWQAKTAQPTRTERDLWKLTVHFRPSGIRVKPATYLPALVAITQTSVIGSRRRRITPVEAGRMQGLPDTVFPNAGVKDKVAYKQAGNAVNVGAVQHAARTLFRSNGLPWGTK